MTPDPEDEYYKSIDDHFFDGVAVEDKHPEPILSSLSRFEKCKAGQLRIKTTLTEISAAIK